MKISAWFLAVLLKGDEIYQFPHFRWFKCSLKCCWLKPCFFIFQFEFQTLFSYSPCLILSLSSFIRVIPTLIISFKENTSRKSLPSLQIDWLQDHHLRCLQELAFTALNFLKSLLVKCWLYLEKKVSMNCLTKVVSWLIY